jgi:non-canonical (house-cleaning) NTP pyrophosphatase
MNGPLIRSLPVATSADTSLSPRRCAQPWGKVETRQGALARAKACHAAHEAALGKPPDFAVGLEGGCIEEDLASAHPTVAGLGTLIDSSGGGSSSDGSKTEVSCFAVMAILKASAALESPRWGLAETASFSLPAKIVRLMRGDPPMELGDADDKVFSDINSKQKGGTIGKVTKGLIDRTKYYEHALLCGLAPFMHDDTRLYEAD